MSLPVAQEAPPRPKTLQILVVDDDADMRLYIAGCLRTLGSVEVFEAADGREALLLARALLPDLVVSDVVMPGLDGHSLSRALRADLRTTAIPVLLISGETHQPPHADGFILKPFNAARLRAEAERLLEPPA